MFSINNPFLKIVQEALEDTVRNSKMYFLDKDPVRNAQGWYTWKLSEVKGAGGIWQMEFSVKESTGEALVQVFPIGWTAPGNSSVTSKSLSGSVGDIRLNVGEAIKSGIDRARKYSFFQKFLQENAGGTGEFERTFKENLIKATHRFDGLSFSSQQPIRNVNGRLTWELTWDMGNAFAFGKWDIVLTVEKEQGRVEAKIKPFGFTSSGVVIPYSVKAWPFFDVGAFLLDGVRKAKRSGLFQKFLQVKKGSKVASFPSVVSPETKRIVKPLMADLFRKSQKDPWVVADAAYMVSAASGVLAGCYAHWSRRFPVISEMFMETDRSSEKINTLWESLMPDLENNFTQVSASRVASRHLEAQVTKDVWVYYDRTAIYFEFDWPLYPMDWIHNIPKQADACRTALEKAVDLLQKQFGGREKKVSDKAKMYYSIRDEDGRLVLTGSAPAANGVFGLDVPAEVQDIGGTADFEKALSETFHKAGWTVKDRDDLIDWDDLV